MAGWAAFAGLWIWQLDGHVPAAWALGPAALAGGLAWYALVTPAWVWWNRNIYRRRHTRRQPLLRTVQLDRDALGRPILADLEARAFPQVVEVLLNSDKSVKTYIARPGGTEAPPASHAAA